MRGVGVLTWFVLVALICAPAGADDEQLNYYCNLRASELEQSASIVFAPSSAQLRTSANAFIDELAIIAADCPASILDIGGHTDNYGNEIANQRLSLLRADSVRQALVQRGVSLNRILTYGFGDAEPIASNETREGRAQNRRITLRFVQRNRTN